MLNKEKRSMIFRTFIPFKVDEVNYKMELFDFSLELS